MVEATDATFEEEVLRSPQPVIVDFWAPWCRPCEAVGRVLDELEGEHGETLRFVRVNIDESPVFASRYGVLALPTVILFDGGHPGSTVAGTRSREYFERAWASWLDR